MTISRTTRFGLYRWSSFIDAFTRTQMDESYENVEQYGLKMLRGSDLPDSGSAEYAGTFFLNTTDNKLYYYTTADANGEWIKIEPNGIRYTEALASGDMLVASAANEWERLPAGTRNQILTVTSESGDIGWTTILNNRGDLLTSDGTNTSILPAGDNFTSLRANSSQTGGLQWGLIVEANLANSAITTSKITDNSVSSTAIANSAVTESVLGAGSVTTSKFASSSVTTGKIADGAVTSSKIADLAVTSDKFASGAVTDSKIADGSVTTVVLADASVVSSKIADSAVTYDKIASNAITTSKFGAGSVTSTKILDGAVASSKFAISAITTDKIDDLAVNTSSIADGAATTSKFAAFSVTPTQIADSSIIEINVADGAVGESKIADLAVGEEKFASLTLASVDFADASVDTSSIALNAVTNDKIRAAQGLSVIGNASSSVGNVDDIVASTDHGVLKRSGSTLTFGLVESADLQTGIITTSKIAAGAVSDTNVSGSAAISLGKLGSGQLKNGTLVSTANYASGSFTSSKLSTGSNGVGIWESYTPTLYLVRAMEVVKSGTSVDWVPQFSRLDTPLPWVEPTSRYTVRFARYCRMNNLCIVSASIEYNFENTLYPNYTLPTGVAYDTNETKPSTIIPSFFFLSLPFVPESQARVSCGVLRFYSTKNIDKQITVGSLSTNLRAYINRKFAPTPIIYNNMLTAIVTDRAYEWDLETFVQSNSFSVTIGNPDFYRRYSGDDPALYDQVLRNRTTAVTFIPGLRLDFTISYVIAT